MQESDAPFKLVAGHPALDFVNTLDNVYSADGTVDSLLNYADLLRFCEQAGMISTQQKDRLGSTVGSHDQQSVLRQVRDLRSCCFRLFTDLAADQPLQPNDLDKFNTFLPDALRNQTLKLMEAGSPVWSWLDVTAEARGPLWPLVVKAANLLASEERRLVRACQDQTCRWLFLDTSKNHSRRWCDMKLCGNRAKARLHYQRNQLKELG